MDSSDATGHSGDPAAQPARGGTAEDREWRNEEDQDQDDEKNAEGSRALAATLGQGSRRGEAEDDET